MKEEREDERMIHIRLPYAIHKRLRILVAELDTNIQKWVEKAIMKELEAQKKGKRN